MIKQEIFAAGKWNGFPFNVGDLHKMASAFNKLKDKLKVPLKMGHNDEQKITDGQPALGWVTELEVDENQTPAKLVAVFEDMPTIVTDAIKKKLYRNVSIELDFDVTHKGEKYDYVVTAVALLGADLPAVNVLNDLGSFLASRNSDMPASEYSANRHFTFTAISEEERNMKTVEELQAELAQKEAELATVNAKFTTLETKSQTEIDAMKAKFAAIEQAQKAEQVKTARAKFTAILEDAVKAQAITPAQRETFAAVLRIDNDEEVVKLDEAKVKALFATTKVESEQTGHHGSNLDDDRPDTSLASKVDQYIAKTGEKDYGQALFTVMRAEPHLAAQYIDMNGEVQ